MRLEAVNQSLSKIYSLQQKHHSGHRRIDALCQVVLEGDEEIQSQKERLDKAEKTAWKLEQIWLNAKRLYKNLPMRLVSTCKTWYGACTV